MHKRLFFSSRETTADSRQKQRPSPLIGRVAPIGPPDLIYSVPEDGHSQSETAISSRKTSAHPWNRLEFVADFGRIGAAGSVHRRRLIDGCVSLHVCMREQSTVE